MEIHALRAQGWTISAIARHVNADRKTVRAYLSGVGTPGVRLRGTPDEFAPFVECRRSGILPEYGQLFSPVVARYFSPPAAG